MKNFEIYTDLLKAEEQFEIAKKNYIAAVSLFNKVFKSELPENWQASYNFSDNRLIIIHYESENEEAPLISFKQICDIASNAGIILKKDTAYFGESLVFLDATAKYKIEDCEFKIHIRQCQVDKCEIEYKEVLEKKAVLTGFCAEVLK